MPERMLSIGQVVELLSVRLGKRIWSHNILYQIEKGCIGEPIRCGHIRSFTDGDVDKLETCLRSQAKE